MQVKTNADDLLSYLSDASNMQGGHASKLFIPEFIDELSEVLREANSARTPVTISGARTGTVGGAIPFGGYVVSVEKLNKIKSINKQDRSAVVEPGVILGDLQKAVEAEGLFYPPDPTEWSCQIGGTVATNASGARSFKYGATRDHVNRIKVVLATGEIIDIRRSSSSAQNGFVELQTKNGLTMRVGVPTYKRPNVRKNVSGYFNGRPLDPIDLFIGSEGTLGVIAEVELSLLPKPEGVFGGIVFFPNESDLLDLVSEARELSVAAKTSFGATLLEYFDANALRFISAKFPQTPVGMAGAIYFEQESSAATEDTLLEQWNELLERHRADLEVSWFTTNEQDRQKMRDFRHALPVAVNERILRSGKHKVGTDMSVPDETFRSFLQFYKDVLNASGLEYVMFGHIGDGHLHANMIPKNDAESRSARHIYGRCVAQALMLGGTVSAEHGIGKLKRKYLSAMMGERYLNEMAAIKRSFDPNGILGRGNIFDESYL